jgi:hypothetical protein
MELFCKRPGNGACAPSSVIRPGFCFEMLLTANILNAEQPDRRENAEIKESFLNSASARSA